MGTPTVQEDAKESETEEDWWENMMPKEEPKKSKKKGASREVDPGEEFSEEEMKVLVEEVEKRKEALFGDYKEGESPRSRWLIWLEVAEKVNDISVKHRNVEQVRIKWFHHTKPEWRNSKLGMALFMKRKNYYKPVLNRSPRYSYGRQIFELKENSPPEKAGNVLRPYEGSDTMVIPKLNGGGQEEVTYSTPSSGGTPSKPADGKEMHRYIEFNGKKVLLDQYLTSKTVILKDGNKWMKITPLPKQTCEADDLDKWVNMDEEERKTRLNRMLGNLESKTQTVPGATPAPSVIKFKNYPGISSSNVTGVYPAPSVEKFKNLPPVSGSSSSDVTGVFQAPSLEKFKNSQPVAGTSKSTVTGIFPAPSVEKFKSVKPVSGVFPAPSVEKFKNLQPVPGTSTSTGVVPAPSAEKFKNVTATTSSKVAKVSPAPSLEKFRKIQPRPGSGVTKVTDPLTAPSLEKLKNLQQSPATDVPKIGDDQKSDTDSTEEDGTSGSFTEVVEATVDGSAEAEVSKDVPENVSNVSPARRTESAVELTKDKVPEAVPEVRIESVQSSIYPIVTTTAMLLQPVPGCSTGNEYLTAICGDGTAENMEKEPGMRPTLARTAYTTDKPKKVYPRKRISVGSISQRVSDANSGKPGKNSNFTLTAPQLLQQQVIDLTEDGRGSSNRSQIDSMAESSEEIEVFDPVTGNKLKLKKVNLPLQKLNEQKKVINILRKTPVKQAEMAVNMKVKGAFNPIISNVSSLQTSEWNKSPADMSIDNFASFLMQPTPNPAAKTSPSRVTKMPNVLRRVAPKPVNILQTPIITQNLLQVGNAEEDNVIFLMQPGQVFLPGVTAVEMTGGVNDVIGDTALILEQSNDSPSVDTVALKKKGSVAADSTVEGKDSDGGASELKKTDSENISGQSMVNEASELDGSKPQSDGLLLAPMSTLMDVSPGEGVNPVSPRKRARKMKIETRPILPPVKEPLLIRDESIITKDDGVLVIKHPITGKMVKLRKVDPSKKAKNEVESDSESSAKKCKVVDETNQESPSKTAKNNKAKV